MKKINLTLILWLFISTSLRAEEKLLNGFKYDTTLSFSELPEQVPEQVPQQVPTATSDDYSYEEIKKIQNDKEVQISFMDSYEISRIQRKFSNAEEKEKLRTVFVNNLHSFLNNKDTHCESKYIKDLIRDLEQANIKTTKEEVVDVFKVLRVNNSIDDVFYDVLINLVSDYYAFSKVNITAKPVKNIFKNYDKKIAGYDLNELFQAFKKYPDEVDSCSYIEYLRMREKVGSYNDLVTVKNDDLKDLAFVALNRNIISLETFNKIKFLGKDSTIQNRKIWMNDYFKIIFQAKNKMIPFKRSYKVINLADEDTFSSEKVSRFSQLTRRKLLYQKYDENQIVLLSQVMRKASQRMGVDPDTRTGVPYLVQEFDVLNASGSRDNLVEKIELDTQDQFNLARRLLRKDMVALQMMKSFEKVKISYEDMVMASLETGYISLDDIAYVVKYDDLWNPEISKAERFLQMTFKVAGYSTFFLPPPWNVTGALTLAIVEGIVDSKTINGASNDNPNTFIE